MRDFTWGSLLWGTLPNHGLNETLDGTPCLSLLDNEIKLTESNKNHYIISHDNTSVIMILVLKGKIPIPIK